MPDALFPPCHSVNRILSLCLYLIPKIICKCTAAILFSLLSLPLSLALSLLYLWSVMD